MNLDDGLKRKLKSCTSLMSLPTIALQIIDIAEDPEIGLKDIEKVIQNDPALSAKLIRVANSPLFSRGRSVETIFQALALLGVDSAVSLALSFSLMGALQDNASPEVNAAFWRRAVISAVFAKELAQIARLGSTGSAFLAGLLQDIGILALKQLDGPRYLNLFLSAQNHTELQERERVIYGADHADIGGILAESWRLPSSLREAMARSHAGVSTASDDPQKLQVCVCLSGHMADVLSTAMQPEEYRVIANLAALINIDEAAIGEAIEKTAAQLPDLSSLFEIDLIDDVELNSIQEKSKELLLMRTVHNEIKAREQAEQAASIERRSRNLEEQARRDGLTGAFNRGYLDNALSLEFSCASQHKTSLSVAFVDLDRFKSINDNYGHQAGDQVLRSVASVINQHKRTSDILARFGGEEFILVMPGTEQKEAIQAAQRLLETLRSQAIAIGENKTIQITASVGVATYGATGLNFDNADQLVKAADIALYDAKQTGRDRVCVYPPRPAGEVRSHQDRSIL